jgi:hypothetical protein
MHQLRKQYGKLLNGKLKQIVVLNRYNFPRELRKGTRPVYAASVNCPVRRGNLIIERMSAIGTKRTFN